MKKDSKDFLYELLSTPSPSGFEQGLQKVVCKRMEPIADSLKIDVHGNLIANLNPKGSIRVMLAGHSDQIGLMVTHIDDKGFISFKSIGGVDPSILLGSRVQIHSSSGIINGVIGHTPIHLLSVAERGKKVDMKKLWIDTGIESVKELKKKVKIGDSITFINSVCELGKNKISAVGCDNRVGVFVVMEAMRIFKELLKKRKKKSDVSLFSVSTVQEEIGLRGARTSSFSIDPLVGIAVDVTHASDNPGANPKEIGDIKLGAGAAVARGANINPVLEKLFYKASEKKKIKIQVYPEPSATGTDANAIQITRSGVATGLVSIANRYMHTSVEVVDLRDLVSASELIAETLIGINSKMDFIPR